MNSLKAFLICFLILGNCANFQGQRTIKFDDGREATIFFAAQETDSGEKVFVVNFRTERIVKKEIEVEKDVMEIWKNVKRDAEQSEAEEGVINYSFWSGETSSEGKRIYLGFIFNADRMENGEWSIKRVD